MRCSSRPVAALRQADLIFQLGEELPATVRDAATTPGVRLAVGISAGLPKLVVQALMQPVLDEPRLRLRCHEAPFEELLADLALHRLDVVLADQAAPASANIKLYSHALGASGFAWYAPPSLHAASRRGFPQSLERVPVLLPTAQSVVRQRLDQWFEREGLRPMVVGEFDDSALLKTFGAGGLGVFPAAAMVHEELTDRYGVRRIGECDGVEEHFWAIGSEKKVAHPLVQRLLRVRSR
jgi:LysR family transcriptional activator of nhaA